MTHVGDSNPHVLYAESNALSIAPGRISVVIPGRDLPHDLPASCTDTLKTNSRPIYINGDQAAQPVILYQLNGVGSR